jgi:hypothetical protein
MNEMKTFLMFWFLIILTNINGILAQCTNKLVEMAALKCGPNAITIKEFKIKFEEGTMKKPSPVGRYSVLLSEGMHYRITLVNAAAYEGQGVLQLYDKTLLLGSTYNVETGEDHQQFDFICKKTKTYQVIAFFREAKPGCMAGVLALIIPDSMNVTENEHKKNILYIGIDNPIVLGTTYSEKTLLKVRISQGTIEGSDSEFTVRVDKEGQAIVYADIYNINGEKLESDSLLFEVKPLPLPLILFAGKQGGVIFRDEIANLKSIDLMMPVSYMKDDYYTLAECEITTDKTGFNRIHINGNQLSQFQKENILKLPPGSIFYIINAIVKSPDGKSHHLPSQTYWIQ